MNRNNQKEGKMNFRKVIAVRLAELDMNKGELADKAGITEPTLRKVMTKGGTDSVNLNSLVKISKALNIDVWSLIKDANNG